jgi:DnaJ family protein C protein 3
MFVKLETLESASDWMGMTRVVIPGKGKGVNLAAKLDELLEAAASESSLPPRISASPQLHSTRRRIPYRAACKAYIKLNDPRKAKQWCEEVLRMDGDDVDGLVGMGEMRLVEEEWEDAVRLFSSAFEKTGNSSGEVDFLSLVFFCLELTTQSQIREKLDRARRLLKQSKAKDYYKVLGVSRDADQRTIKKA